MSEEVLLKSDSLLRIILFLLLSFIIIRFDKVERLNKYFYIVLLVFLFVFAFLKIGNTKNDSIKSFYSFLAKHLPTYGFYIVYFLLEPTKAVFQPIAFLPQNTFLSVAWIILLCSVSFCSHIADTNIHEE